MPIGISIKLHDMSGVPVPNLTDLTVCWWDVDHVKDFQSPVGKSTVATTNASGDLVLDLTYVSGRSVGEFGFLAVYQLNATDYKDSPTFFGKIEVETITGGTVLGIVDDYVRNPAWLSVPDTTNKEQFAGLVLVYPDKGNVVTLLCEGNYTVDWGDGTVQNFASGVKAERNIDYSSVDPLSEVALVEAVPVTFDGATNRVVRVAHGFLNNELVAFASIAVTTGIAEYAQYYVANATADNFQLSTSSGGAVIDLVTNGNGTIYKPQFRQVIVSVVPNGGTLTKLDLQQTYTGRINNVYASWEDIDISLPNATALILNGTTPAFFMVKEIKIRDPGLVTDFSKMFYNCRSLENVILEKTSAVTDVSDLFHYCLSLRTIPLIDTSSVTDFSYMFCLCFKLRSCPLLNTSNGIDFTFMLYSCVLLETVPLLDTSKGIYFKGFVGACSRLSYFPLLDTSNGVDFSNMLYNCYALLEVPLLNTSKGTNFSNMFRSCYAIKTIPHLDTSEGVDFSNMFYNCYGLLEVPLLNTSKGIIFSNMLYSCTVLANVPEFDVSNGTDFNFMFRFCYDIKTIPHLDTSKGLNFTSMFHGCNNLSEIPLLDTSKGTNFTSMFESVFNLSTIPLLDTSKGLTFTNMFNACYDLRSVPPLDVSSGTIFTNIFGATSVSSAPLKGGTRSISYLNNFLSASELDAIYTNLGVAAGAQTITVTGNPGVTGDTPGIATAKGWTVVG